MDLFNFITTGTNQTKYGAAKQQNQQKYSTHPYATSAVLDNARRANPGYKSPASINPADRDMMLANQVDPDVMRGYQAPLPSDRATLPLQQATVAPINRTKVVPVSPEANPNAPQPATEQDPAQVEEVQQKAQAAKQVMNQEASQHDQASSPLYQAHVEKANELVDKVASGQMSHDEALSQPWVNDSFGGFTKGLVTLGLSMMSGATPQQAYDASIGAMKNANQSDWILNNRSKLVDQGYSETSIQAAAAAGDASLLKYKEYTPEEQRQQKIADSVTEQKNKLEILNTKSADQKAIETMRAEDKAEAKQKEKELAAQDAESQPFSTLPKGRSGNNAQMTSLAKRYDKNITNWRMADQAYASLQGLENADPREQLSVMQAEGDRLARSLLGGNATLTPEQIKEITGSPMSMDKFADWLTTNTDQGRAARAIKYMSQIAKASRDGYSYTIRNDVSKDRDNMKRYNNGDPHKTTQDILTVAGIDPQMFMRPDELEEFNQSGRWVKTGGIHEKYGKEREGALNKTQQTNQPAPTSNAGADALKEIVDYHNNKNKK